METSKSMCTMETKKKLSDRAWWKSLKWWQKLIYVDFALSFCLVTGAGVEDGAPMWPLFVLVGNFGLSVYLLNKYVPTPDDE